MFAGEEMPWKSPADNLIEYELMDDDFSDAIDGSGYVYSLDYSETPD